MLLPEITCMQNRTFGTNTYCKYCLHNIYIGHGQGVVGMTFHYVDISWISAIQEKKLDINFTMVYNTSFLYVLQVQKIIMCIFWWHKFGLFVPSFMGCAMDKNVIIIIGIHNYIYSSLVINGLNRHLDRYVMFQTVRKLHPAKTVVTHWWDKKILSQWNWIMSIWL